MGGRGSRSNLLRASNIPVPPQTQPQPQPVNTQPPQPNVDAQGFSDTDAAAFHDLYNGRQYYQRQNLDIDARTALEDYLDPNQTGGTMYNFSQNMNNKIATGQPLTAQEQFVKDSLTDAMHNLGYNVNLTRYDHGEFLDDRLAAIGYKGTHNGVSVSRLKQVLVGQTYTDPRILSTSYNNFKNATDPSTFTTREVKIVYKAKASTQALMPGRGPGGDFGEMLLAPSRNGHNTYKIVDVRTSGAKARPKGGSKTSLTLQQIEVVVEVD